MDATEIYAALSDRAKTFVSIEAVHEVLVAIDHVQVKPESFIRRTMHRALSDASFEQIAQTQIQREISRTHQAGFLWDAAKGVFVEADARFRTRIKIVSEFRGRVDCIRGASGSTMQKLYIDDAVLRIENMSLRHEIESVALAVGAPGRFVHASAPMEEPDESYKRRIIDHIRLLAS
jgi:hypothetical protein